MKITLERLPDYLWELVLSAHAKGVTISASHKSYKVGLTYVDNVPVVTLSVPFAKVDVSEDQESLLFGLPSLPASPPSTFSPSAALRVEALSGTTKTVYNFFLSHKREKLTKVDICEGVNKTPSVVSRCLKELIKRQHIEMLVEAGKPVFTFIEPF